MNEAKENMLLHPVRLRILLATAGRQVTARQLAAELPDIPQASLYRNLNILTAAGILGVVQERRVHNTLEKTYALPDPSGLLLSRDDLKNALPEDHIRLFTHFLGQLLGYFVRYIQQGSVDFAGDNVTILMAPLYLSEAEMQSLGQSINAALLPYLNNGPSAERKRSIIGLLSLPDTVSAARSAEGAHPAETVGHQNEKVQKGK